MRLVPLSPLWIAICLHLLRAEPCFHDDTRSRTITWLGLDPRPRSRLSTPWKVSPFSPVIFGLHFADIWFTIRGSLEHIHKYIFHITPAYSQAPNYQKSKMGWGFADSVTVQNWWSASEILHLGGQNALHVHVVSCGNLWNSFQTKKTKNKLQTHVFSHEPAQ